MKREKWTVSFQSSFRCQFVRNSQEHIAFVFILRSLRPHRPSNPKNKKKRTMFDGKKGRRNGSGKTVAYIRSYHFNWLVTDDWEFPIMANTKTAMMTTGWWSDDGAEREREGGNASNSNMKTKKCSVSCGLLRVHVLDNKTRKTTTYYRIKTLGEKLNVWTFFFSPFLPLFVPPPCWPRSSAVSLCRCLNNAVFVLNFPCWFASKEF